MTAGRLGPGEVPWPEAEYYAMPGFDVDDAACLEALLAIPSGALSRAEREADRAQYVAKREHRRSTVVAGRDLAATAAPSAHPDARAR